LPGTIDGQSELVPFDLAFSIPQLRTAPAAYRVPVQLVCGVDDAATLDERQPDTSRGSQEFATRLFGVLRCVHRRLQMTLSRPGGSSVDSRAISPDGRLQDPYFLTGPGDAPGIEIRQGQHQDVVRALQLALVPHTAMDAARVILLHAVTAYWRTASLTPEVTSLIDAIAAQGRESSRKVGELGAIILTGGD
jgi:hypothetical protein